jgi:hypothetical protein
MNTGDIHSDTVISKVVIQIEFLYHLIITNNIYLLAKLINLKFLISEIVF